MNGTPDVAAVTEGGDESGDDGVGEFVGAAEEGVCGGEEGVREQDIGDGGVTGARVRVVVWVGYWIGGPVEKIQGVMGALHVLDDLDHQAWGEGT